MTLNLNFGVILPELLFLVIASLIFLVDKFIKNKSYAFYLSIITLGVGTLLVFHFGNFTNAYRNDLYTILFKIFFTFGTLLILAISYNYFSDYKNLKYGEYYALLLFSLLGGYFMISAMDLITVDLSMELLSFPVYILIALNFLENKKSLEGAIKYFLLGSLGGVFILMGIGVIYYYTHSVSFSVISEVISNSFITKGILLGFLLMLTGFSIKLSLVPFHMWSPDAYESAPVPVTSFIAGLVKFIVIATLVKIIILGFGGIKAEIGKLLIPIALLTILIGNTLAVKQDNIIRMLAYSSIAHAGYAILGIIGADYMNYRFTLFYMFVYMLMTIGTFSLLIVLARRDKSLLWIPNLKGLSKSSPFLSFLFLIFMFSLAGVPPTAGFIAKFYLFMALVKAHYILVAVLAILFSVIGAYPYLRVLKVIYMEDTEKRYSFSYGMSFLVPVLLTSFLIIVIGVFPQPWDNLFHKAIYCCISFLLR